VWFPAPFGFGRSDEAIWMDDAHAATDPPKADATGLQPQRRLV
jgi:hypothetical protein